MNEFLRDPYFELSPPKSTGRDRFGISWLTRSHPDPWSQLSGPDQMSTLLDLTIESIAIALERFVFPEGPIVRVITAGGGALNGELMGRLQARLKGIPVTGSDEFGVPVMAREAMAFAALGDALIRGRPGNVPAATGARKPVLLGTLAW